MRTKEEQSELLAAAISEQISEFQGVRVRADAGEEGRVYVALRGAKKNREIAALFAAKLEALVESTLMETGYRLSQGRGDKDLLFLIEILD